MAPQTQREIVANLLDRYGTTYASEVGIRLKDKPAPLFQLLVAALLFSARIPAANATRGARALIRRGRLTTPRRMASSSWERRVRILGAHGYARYDESAARMLGESAALLLDRYGGDLRALRERAKGDPRRIRELLRDFKGIGNVGASIFLREAQAVWPDIAPFADDRVACGARRLGLPKSPDALAELVDGRPGQMARLAAALTRVELQKVDPVEILDPAA